MNNLVVFATYWNEIDWIEKSLKQIENLNPRKVIICDGCYDDSKHNGSTDGTREVIEKFISDHENAQMIEALRFSKATHFFKWFNNLSHEKTFSLHPARIIEGFKLFRFNNYRLNQMATFNKMLSMAFEDQKEGWFMSYDADQFYTDEMIDQFDYVNTNDSSYDLLVGTERTFIDDYNQYTLEHEVRDYNNMPHRLTSSTRFIPTRHPSLIKGFRYKIYSYVQPKKDVGFYNHYKFSSERSKLGYSLGDRKEMRVDGLKVSNFEGVHPKAIRDSNG